MIKFLFYYKKNSENFENSEKAFILQGEQDFENSEPSYYV